MKIKAVLFDLDGTLLPMDQNVFVKAYFSGIAKRLARRGYESEKLINTIWLGTGAMVKNNGEKTNEEVFWQVFEKNYGKDPRLEEPYFEEFYREDFDDVQKSCGFTEKAEETVSILKKLGLRLVLATNPIFPQIATQKRIAWAGLKPDDFELYTTYENCRFCKPNLNYYKDILEKLDLSAEQCLMVGNDYDDDIVAEKLGMKVFLLTDCLINKNGADISSFPQGSFNDLIEYIKNNI